jgi:hypothetical protein
MWIPEREFLPRANHEKLRGGAELHTDGAGYTC